MTCPDCEGKGFVWVDDFDPGSRYGHTEREIECRECDGTGEIKEEDDERNKNAFECD